MRIIGLIQARMASTRLPGKVLKEINGMTLIRHIYRRLLACQELDGVSVITGSYEYNRELWAYCQANGINVESRLDKQPDENLLTRYSYALTCHGQNGYHAFVRVTADCLFHDPQLIDNMVATYRNRYPKVRGLANWLPHRTISEGLDCEVMSTELLAQLDRDPQCPRETFMTYAGERGYLSPYGIQKDSEDLHLSIDTQEDFDRAEKMLKILGNDEWRYGETIKAYRAVASG